MVNDGNITIVELQETDSTNNWLKEHREMPDGTVFKIARADFQSSGRGQRGNCWESEPHSNLLFSILSRPGFVRAGDQFCLSEAISLAITDTLMEMNDELARFISVKWPNDIYWKEKKLAGILIENTIQGQCLADSIIGIGLNVNQPVFRSDAPNPVSIRNIIGLESDCGQIFSSIIMNFAGYYQKLSEGGREEIHSKYLRRLFRIEGLHPYRDSAGQFLAGIETVRPDGILKLRDTDGNLRSYEFKQVSYILQSIS